MPYVFLRQGATRRVRHLQGAYGKPEDYGSDCLWRNQTCQVGYWSSHASDLADVEVPELGKRLMTTVHISHQQVADHAPKCQAKNRININFTYAPRSLDV